MEKEKIIDDFLNDDLENQKEVKKKKTNKKNVTIERIDKIMVTEDGRQLLREVY